EEPPHAVLRTDPPERSRIGRTDRLSLVEDGGAAVQERPIDDVRVADDPSDVARRPVHLAGLDAVDRLHRVLERDGVAAVVANDSLRAPRRTARVEDVERIRRLYGNARDRLRALERLVPVGIPAGGERGLL